MERTVLSLSYSSEPTSSRLVIGHKLNIAHEIAPFIPSDFRLALLTDSNLASNIALSLQENLQKAGLSSQVFSFPAGECAKNRSTKENLEDELLKEGYGRDSVIMGVGGGITTDLAGFIAATFCRGVPFIAIPTTLMGMIDASLGGKTAVNTPFAKNMIGAFYPPSCVIIDTDFLSTLSQKRLSEGFAEIVKYSLIASAPLFTTLLHGYFSWHERDVVFLHHLIEQSCAIKSSIIQKDPHEKGLRRILNFGHTIGHALEIASLYHLSHGEAIAIGMLAESRLSHRLGFLGTQDLEQIEHLYSLYHLPVTSCLCDANILCKALQLDKKNRGGHVRLVTLDAIGSASTHDGHYCTAIDLELIQSLFDAGTAV